MLTQQVGGYFSRAPHVDKRGQGYRMGSDPKEEVSSGSNEEVADALSFPRGLLRLGRPFLETRPAHRSGGCGQGSRVWRLLHYSCKNSPIA